MPNIVPGYGSSSAKLMIIGEAPGSNEEQTLIPFSGPSGKLLDQALDRAGSHISECYKTNVVKVRPPNNDLSKLNLIGYKIEDFKDELWNEINTINPNCILVLGNTALQAVTNLKGIKHYRGSILQSAYSNHKVVASLHPAGLLHDGSSSEIKSWKEYTWIKFDVKRAVEQSLFPEIRRPARCLNIARSSYDVWDFLNRHKGKIKASIDVETFKTFVQCIGIAFDSYEALSIPIMSELIPPHDLCQIWKLLSEFFNDLKIDIIAQNAKFDEKRCRQIGLPWIKPCWFSLDMGFHILFPEFPKKLEFIASILTEEPYWKDEGKEFNFHTAKNLDQWYLYNAKDAVVEFECAEVILSELKNQNLYDFFFERIQPLYKIYYDMEDTGILVDKDIRKNLKKKYTNLWKEKQANLAKLIGDNNPETTELYKDFNVMSNGPKNQVAKLLFGLLKIPVRADTSEETLKSLANNVVKDQRKKDIIKTILEIRKVRKTIGTYLNAALSNNEPWLL